MSKFMKLCSFSTFSLLFLSCATLAADAMPKIDCTLTTTPAEYDSVVETTVFDKTTKVIYLICESDEVQKGQDINVAWIAVNTNNVAPANYKIDEKDYMMTRDLGSNENWTGKFSLSEPTAGWPVGSYKADLYVNKQLVNSYAFTVK